MAGHIDAAISELSLAYATTAVRANRGNRGISGTDQAQPGVSSAATKKA